ncbi:MAG TPA: hypothetical protein VH186_31860 [Chloroflexia bacterium]|nr:hypothetical protein [Chloroflexia bacterium]
MRKYLNWAAGLSGPLMLLLVACGDQSPNTAPAALPVTTIVATTTAAATTAPATTSSPVITVATPPTQQVSTGVAVTDTTSIQSAGTLAQATAVNAVTGSSAFRNNFLSKLKGVSEVKAENELKARLTPSKKPGVQDFDLLLLYADTPFEDLYKLIDGTMVQSGYKLINESNPPDGLESDYIHANQPDVEVIYEQPDSLQKTFSKLQLSDKALTYYRQQFARHQNALLILYGTGLYQTEGTGQTTPTAAASISTTPASHSEGQIIYATSDNQIYLADSDGSHKTKVAEGSSPLFSPDAKTVAFISVPESTTDPTSPASWIETVALDGSNLQKYCQLSGHYLFSLQDWSPDSQLIVVSQDSINVHLLNRCALKTKKLSDFANKQGDLKFIYNWSRDGKYAVWETADDPNASDETSSFTLYYGAADGDGIDAKALTNGQHANSTPRYYSGGSISPDGKTVAIAGDSIFFVSTPGQSSPLAGKLFFKGANPYNVVWSRSGMKLAAVISTGNNESYLKIIEAATGKELLSIPQVTALDWSVR